MSAPTSLAARLAGGSAKPRPALRHTPAPVAARLSAPAALWWTLRAGAFLCFVGHGAFGVITKEAWVPFFAVAGVGREMAYRLMPLVGALDILLGTLALLRPRAAVVAYMALWAVWTAALRPITGMPVWEMFERAGNYGVPAALLLLTARSGTVGSWVAPTAMRALTPSLVRRVRVALAVTTALLLLGHGALGVQGKPEIVEHFALLAPLRGATLARTFGWAEIVAAGVVLWRQPVALCLGLCGWKLATEALFVVAGAPIWEVVERGGSYVAPLALAIVARYLQPSEGAEAASAGHAADDADRR